jgi:hypothetical protein
MSMLPSCVLTAFASPSFSLADLRSQTPVIIVGFILLAVGMAAVTLFFFRRKSRDLGLIYFRIFSVLYAVRLLLRMRVVRSLAGVSDSLVDHINLWITFTLLIPFLLSLRLSNLSSSGFVILCANCRSDGAVPGRDKQNQAGGKRT